MDEVEFTPQAVLRELWAIAMTRTTDVVAVQDGQPVLRDTGSHAQAAIASVEKGSGGLKVKLYDKLKALELLGKHMGLFDGGGSNQPPQSNLIEVLLAGTCGEVDTHGLPELEPPAEAGYDLVEQAGSL